MIEKDDSKIYIEKHKHIVGQTVNKATSNISLSCPNVCGCVGMRERRWGQFLGEKIEKVQARTAGNYPFWNPFIPRPRPKSGARVLSWAPSCCTALLHMSRERQEAGP